MDCFGTYFTHAQTCDNVRVQSATGWTASVHTLHMPKPVITFVFKVLRDGLLRYILYTCPNVSEKVKFWRAITARSTVVESNTHGRNQRVLRCTVKSQGKKRNVTSEVIRKISKVCPLLWSTPDIFKTHNFFGWLGGLAIRSAQGF